MSASSEKKKGGDRRTNSEWPQEFGFILKGKSWQAFSKESLWHKTAF